MRKNKLEKEINNALYKKAFGYDANEVVEEFVVSDDGDYKLSKRKITKKHISPDLNAVKILLDNIEQKNDRFESMSDEELLKEKLKLLELLEKYKK